MYLPTYLSYAYIAYTIKNIQIAILLKITKKKKNNIKIKTDVARRKKFIRRVAKLKIKM